MGVDIIVLWATQREGRRCGVQRVINYYLAIFQHVDLLLVDCVLVFLQETLTLVLHLGAGHTALFHKRNENTVLVLRSVASCCSDCYKLLAKL